MRTIRAPISSIWVIRVAPTMSNKITQNKITILSSPLSNATVTQNIFINVTNRVYSCEKADLSSSINFVERIPWNSFSALSITTTLLQRGSREQQPVHISMNHEFPIWKLAFGHVRVKVLSKTSLIMKPGDILKKIVLNGTLLLCMKAISTAQYYWALDSNKTICRLTPKWCWVWCWKSILGYVMIWYCRIMQYYGHWIIWQWTRRLFG